MIVYIGEYVIYQNNIYNVRDVDWINGLVCIGIPNPVNKGLHIDWIWVSAAEVILVE